jgi:hypothetical protein
MQVGTAAAHLDSSGMLPARTCMPTSTRSLGSRM